MAPGDYQVRVFTCRSAPSPIRSCSAFSRSRRNAVKWARGAAPLIKAGVRKCRLIATSASCGCLRMDDREHPIVCGRRSRQVGSHRNMATGETDSQRNGRYLRAVRALSEHLPSCVHFRLGTGSCRRFLPPWNPVSLQRTAGRASPVGTRGLALCSAAATHLRVPQSRLWRGLGSDSNGTLE
jgi:hypothetical protein